MKETKKVEVPGNVFVQRAENMSGIEAKRVSP
jgi:hypothetical protein